MNRDQWNAVDHYITTQLVPADPVLQLALADSAQAGLPSINVTPNQGKLLMLLARMLNAKKILEIGTLGGYSTIWMSRGMAKGGKLITLEAAEKHAQVARNNIARAGLSDVVEIRLGPALESLPKLANERTGPFDLIFIDADKASTTEYTQWAIKLSREGSVIVVDNVVRQGKLVDLSNQNDDIVGVRRFYEMLAKEPRLDATAIQTVGSKGYDGFAIAVVKTAAK
jgi:predicted O-methyltransferase YrrM